jgi:pimeloyl-ACP methyl ester carboxylesterase
MPHYYQFYEDFIVNEERLTIKRAVSHLQIPYLIIHGNNDSSVLMAEAENLHKWTYNSQLEIIDGANHVFGAQHPWDKINLPEHLQEAIKKSVTFLMTCS